MMMDENFDVDLLAQGSSEKSENDNSINDKPCCQKKADDASNSKICCQNAVVEEMSNEEDVIGDLLGFSREAMDEEGCSATESLEDRVEALEKLMEQVVERINGQNRPTREVVTQADFEAYVDEAVSLRDDEDLGVSKIFLRQFLKSNHQIEDTRYMRRRLNAVLKRKVEMNEYNLQGALYSKVKRS